MDQAFATEIRRVDATISMLNEHRHRCNDPVDIIHTGEKIDQWLDERLAFMRRRAGSADQPCATASAEPSG